MKKILVFFALVLLLLNTSNLFAQIHVGKFKAIPVKKPMLLQHPGISVSGTNGALGACDSINFQASLNWQSLNYQYDDSSYVFGTSDNSSFGFNFIEQANYFDISADDYNYVSGGLVYFSYANSSKHADLDKTVAFKIYDDNNGVPGNLLDSTALTLNQIHQDVLNNYLTKFIFPNPVALPASKTFYISVDLSNFQWSNNVKDSICIVANGDDDTTAAAYQKYHYIDDGEEGWIPVSDFYPDTTGGTLDVNLYVFPYVSNTADGCGILPVSIFNFGGNIKNYQAYLNWSTATESNNKGFYVERSKDGRNFSSIGFVNGTINSSKIINYDYTDISLKDINVTTTYYRLKQVDLDGKYTYSKVLPLNLNNASTLRLYPNPVKDIATVELNLETASKVTVQVISRDGRIVITSDKGILSAGTQQVFINTQSLASGSYIIRTTIGDKTYSQLLVKE